MLFINKLEKFWINYFLKGFVSGLFVLSEVEDGCCKDVLKCWDGLSGCIFVCSMCWCGYYVYNFDKVFVI